MMKRFVFISILLILLFLTSCISFTFNPIYTDKDLIFEPALSGLWSEPDSKDTYKFTRSGEKSYELIYTDEDDNKGTFEVHLVNLDGTLFLDIYPGKKEITNNEFYNAHFLVLHSVVYVEQIEPTLKVSMIDDNWLKEYLEENPTSISYQIFNDNVVLTAPTEEVQAFLTSHVHMEDVFETLTEMIRLDK
jgi:hypothetical protein